MKTEIQKTKYNEKSKNADWWTWTENCDQCNETIRKAGDWIINHQPDVKEEDLCLKCLKKIFDIHE